METLTDKKTVMVFDDDPDTLALCTIVLENKGYNVHTRDNSNDVINYIDQYKPDVILMDNCIPGLGGIKATQQIKQHLQYGKIPVIYFSANNNIDLLAQEAGAEKYICKPFNINNLEQIIEEALLING